MRFLSAVKMQIAYHFDPSSMERTLENFVVPTRHTTLQECFCVFDDLWVASKKLSGQQVILNFTMFKLNFYDYLKACHSSKSFSKTFLFACQSRYVWLIMV